MEKSPRGFGGVELAGMVLVTVLVLGGALLLREWNRTKAPESDLTTVLLLGEKEDHRPASAHLLILQPRTGYMHVYRVQLDASFKRWWGGQERFDEKGVGAMMRALRGLLQIDISYFVVLRESAATALLDEFGGSPVFNARSAGVQSGEVLVSARLLPSFLEGIGESAALREDAAFALWVNAWMSSLEYFASWKEPGLLSKAIWRRFDRTNLPRKRLDSIVKELVARQGRWYLSQQRMNTEMPSGAGGPRVPLSGGNYDQEKLREALRRIEKDERSIRVFPLTLQILNGTPYGGIGAKTAGILRIRRLEITEYKNLPFPVAHSVLLDRSGSSAQREYLQKVTRVKRVYYDSDYREGSDWTLVLGEDFHAIDFLTNY